MPYVRRVESLSSTAVAVDEPAVRDYVKPCTKIMEHSQVERNRHKLSTIKR